MDPSKRALLVEKIKKVILSDFSGIMQESGNTTGKFILIAVGIEFLGACLDKQHFHAAARSEKRFNTAILKLFPKRYHHFVKPDSVPNLYTDFRCQVIHQFATGKSILLCTEEEAVACNFSHLSYNSAGSLILLPERFYLDLALAANELIKRLEIK